MEVVIKSVPEWVTKIFGVDAEDICRVERVDERDALEAKKKCYLVRTKTGKSVTVYNFEVNELKVN